jgi:ATP-binding cassette subfamily F protein 3
LKEEASLNARLATLEKEGDDKRFEDAREEASSRLADVHARLSDMDAESGPSRAATLLAGMSISLCQRILYDTTFSGLGFSEADQSKPTRTFSGGWR